MIHSEALGEYVDLLSAKSRSRIWNLTLRRLSPQETCAMNIIMISCHLFIVFEITV